MNKELFFYGLFIIETLFGKLFYSCRVVPKILEKKILKKYPQG